ncbi:MAG: hypothetical protein SPE00_02525 [Bacilli bacterium]|nr:hypothetical protein [Bacilli bacterium]
MKIKHLLIECFCDYDSKDKNSICFTGNKINIDCLKHNCVHFMYTKCPNEIAYANEEGVVEKETDFIGFGDEMEKENVKDKKILINKWKEICREKINEAYEQYINDLNLKGEE